MLLFLIQMIRGEGEHKIMSYLKYNNKKMINIVYGLDADLIDIVTNKKK